MFDLDRWQEIWVTITRNKVRSFLTGLGVFWGIFMLVVMMGASTGLGNGMYEGIEGLDLNSCFMGSNTTGEPYKGFQKGRTWYMRTRDIDVVKDKLPEIDAIAPILFSERSDNNIVFEDNTSTASVKGMAPDYARIENPFLTMGRFINTIDIDQKRKVCVIGTKVYEDLFPKGGDPIGEYIRANGIYYQVIGVAEGVEGIQLNGRTSESVLIPFSTMQQINNQGDIIHMIGATAYPGESAKKLEEEMKAVIKANNHVSPTDMQAMWGFNLEEQSKMFMSLFLGVAIVIWIVGSGTLVAGVVGVSNIMLVTVKERTKEIGVRRALGAKPKTIIGQIMSESLVLTLLAGFLGLSFGVLLLHLADIYWLQDAEGIFLKNPMVSFGTAIGSSIALIICGLIAGALPTYRALKIKAIDAIREE